MRCTLLFAALISTTLSATALGQAARKAQAWEDNAREIPCQRYTLFCDSPDEQARVVAENLDLLHSTCADFFKDLDGVIPTGDQVCVFANQDDYTAWLHDRTGADGTGSAGLYVQRGSQRVLAAWLGDRPFPQLLGTLRHEGLHHVASHMFPGLPRWSAEGLAEVFERAVPVSNGLALGNVRSDDVTRLQQANKQNKLLKLNTLFQLGPDQWSRAVRAGKANVHYLQAWAVVQFLMYGDDERYKDKFHTFLDGMNKGLGWKTAFTETYGIQQYGKLERRFLDFVDDLRPSDLEDVIPRMILLGEGTKTLIDRGEQLPDASVAAGRLQSTGFKTKLPVQYGEGMFSTTAENPFALSKATGGELQFSDNQGNPLRELSRRPCIRTRKLAPRQLMLKWNEDGTWKIVVDN